MSEPTSPLNNQFLSMTGDTGNTPIVVDEGEDDEIQQQTEGQEQTDTGDETPTEEVDAAEVEVEGESGDAEGVEGTKTKSTVNFKDFEEKLNGEREVRKEKGEKGKEKPAEVKTEEVKTPVQGNQKVATRDYSGLDEAEVELFKQTGNKVFAYVKPIVLEHKQLKTALAEKDKKIQELSAGKVSLPDSYYDHPEAYVLHPEYKETAKLKDTVASVAKHWEQQLIRIKKGEDWQDLGQNPQTGEIFVKPPTPSSPEMEVIVSKYYNQSARLLQQTEDKLQGLTKDFKQLNEQASSEVKKAEEQYFPGYNDPKHPTFEMQQKVLNLLPASYRSHPVSDLLAKMAAANAIVRQERDNLKKELEAAKGTAKDIKNAGPTKKVLASSNGKSKGLPNFSAFKHYTEESE